MENNVIEKNAEPKIREESRIIAERLKDLREKKQLSHAKLSKAVKEKTGVSISKDSLIFYEITNAYHTKAEANLGMSVKNLSALASFYHVSVDYLLGRTDDPSPAPAAVDDLGFSPAAVEWLRQIGEVSREDEYGFIRLEGFLQNVNKLFENRLFHSLVYSLCDLANAAEAQRVYSAIPWGAMQQDGVKEKALEMCSNSRVAAYLNLHELLEGPNTPQEVLEVFDFGFSATEVASAKATQSFNRLMDDITKGRLDLKAEIEAK